MIGDAVDQLHHEVRASRRFRCAGIKDLGDVRMIHHRQVPAARPRKRAITCFESIPGLMTLSATFRRLIRLLLLGHVHHAHPALADLLQELVVTDDGTGTFGNRLGERTSNCMNIGNV